LQILELPKSASFRSQSLLVVLTLLCLLPFSNKAFHIDDTLFVWTAQQIAHHPLDPYGFNLNWYRTPAPMSRETKNPPLAAYYAAAAGRIAGWSERSLHLAFLLPALVLVLGTYNLARRFTEYPLVAAAATLLTPGVLVSSTSVMCDTMMAALWVVAIILWIDGLGLDGLRIDGLEKKKPGFLLASAFLIAAAALTKYFGAALIPLLVVYSLARRRRWENWAWYFLIPVLALAGYELWTKALYGHGMFTDASHFAAIARRGAKTSSLAKGLVDLSFAGGCALSALTFAPLLWSRKHRLAAGAVTLIAGFSVSLGWVSLGAALSPRDFHERWAVVGLQLAICIAAGISVLALAAADVWKRRDPAGLFLFLWVWGTFIFAGFLNWTNNARSVLPLIPAVGILLARRIEGLRLTASGWVRLKVAIPLIVSGVLSFWIAWADADMANSARRTAELVASLCAAEKGDNSGATLWFEGHWGFQYYMQSLGSRPVNMEHLEFRPGDFLVIPDNGVTLFDVRPRFEASRKVIETRMPVGIATMKGNLGAGFYSSDWGPLPFAIGRVPAERYVLIRFGPAMGAQLADNDSR
jgi:4-amino-4-deoxy-L-arabinose transferase-like glycosyltransferase